MRALLPVLATLAFLPLAYAGVVQGMVVESLTGLPLARAAVRLQPIARAGGSEQTELTTRAGGTGGFTFPKVAPGLYLLVATREGYYPSAFGQRRPSGQGTPIEVTADSYFVADIHMRHKAALTGRVLDENGVGMSGVGVVAYPARLPLRAAGRAVSDDRGVYRIPFLYPGKYWVRSAAITLEDGSGRLPTFGPEGSESQQAVIHHARVDADTPGADVRPIMGRLFSLDGIVNCPGGQVTLTLSSETGQRTTQAACGGSYRFEGLAPGNYEVLGAAPGLAGFVELSLERDMHAGTLDLTPPPEVLMDVWRGGGGPARANIPVTLFARRNDLSAAEAERQLKLPASLGPGHWEVTARVGPNYYVESIFNDGARFRERQRVEKYPDAFEVFIPAGRQTRLRVTISDQAAHITGTVVSSGKTPVAGIPVFLWPVTAAARRSLGGVKQTLSDAAGGYRFDGLPPGDYRLVATFDASSIDEDVIEAAQAATVRVETGKILTIDLTQWVAP